MGNEEYSEVLTILMVDIVGYTRTTSLLKRESISKFHDIFDNMCLPVFEKYSGNVIKKIGDCFLVTFKSATDSLLCAMELQNSFIDFNKENKKNEKHPIKIRVVAHSGEVVCKNRDIFGDAVNLTSRIEGATNADHIFFTEAVFMAMNKNEIPFRYVGKRKFKGFKHPVKLFCVKKKEKQ